MARAWLRRELAAHDAGAALSAGTGRSQGAVLRGAGGAAQDRAAFLALEAGGDPALIAEVQSLLDSHEQPGEFLDTVTHEFRSQAFAASAARSRIGERIGAYRIVGMLGTGGMGDVFKAVRDDDQYRAEVAIKLMRADVRSALTEQRFRTERQILAGLDHRNIARLLDGGTTEAGVPYVVMELVHGRAHRPLLRCAQARRCATACSSSCRCARP